MWQEFQSRPWDSQHFSLSFGKSVVPWLSQLIKAKPLISPPPTTKYNIILSKILQFMYTFSFLTDKYSVKCSEFLWFQGDAIFVGFGARWHRNGDSSQLRGLSFLL